MPQAPGAPRNCFSKTQLPSRWFFSACPNGALRDSVCVRRQGPGESPRRPLMLRTWRLSRLAAALAPPKPYLLGPRAAALLPRAGRQARADRVQAAGDEGRRGLRRRALLRHVPQRHPQRVTSSARPPSRAAPPRLCAPPRAFAQPRSCALPARSPAALSPRVASLTPRVASLTSAARPPARSLAPLQRSTTSGA